MERRRVPVRRAVVVAVAFASAVAVALGAYVYAPATLGRKSTWVTPSIRAAIALAPM